MLCPLLLVTGCDRVLGLGTVPMQPDALTTCFADDFTGDTLGAQWSVFSPTSADIAVSQHDQLDFHYAQGVASQKYNAVTSVDVHDFTIGSVTAELVMPPALHRETNLKLVRSPNEYYGLHIRYATATDGAPHVTAKMGDSTIVSDHLFNPVTDRWFRIEIDGAAARFETSPDGATWSSQEAATVFPTNALNVTLAAYVPGSANTPTPDPSNDVEWDNVTVVSQDCGSR